MKKIDFYDVLGALADAAVKKTSESPKEVPPTKENGASSAPVGAPTPPEQKSFADKKTVVEMIRRHDELSRRITENAKKAAEAENPAEG